MRKTSKPKWLAIGALALLCGLLILLALPDRGNELVKHVNFQKIKAGMTIEQVNAILGPPMFVENDVPNGNGYDCYTYIGKRDEGNRRTIIRMGFVRGICVEPLFEGSYEEPSPSLRDIIARIRQRLGL